MHKQKLKIYPIYIKLILVCCSSILFTSFSLAENKPSELENCFKKLEDTKDLSDASKIECLGEEFARQDIRLNKAYKAAIQNLKSFDGLKASKIEEFRELQKLWLKYTELKCGFFYDDYFSGTMHRVIASQCKMEEYKKRADELEEIAEMHY